MYAFQILAPGKIRFPRNHCFTMTRWKLSNWYQLSIHKWVQGIIFTVWSLNIVISRLEHFKTNLMMNCVNSQHIHLNFITWLSWFLRQRSISEFDFWDKEDKLTLGPWVLLTTGRASFFGHRSLYCMESLLCCIILHCNVVYHCLGIIVLCCLCESLLHCITFYIVLCCLGVFIGAAVRN